MVFLATSAITFVSLVLVLVLVLVLTFELLERGISAPNEVGVAEADNASARGSSSTVCRDRAIFAIARI